jgi:glycosyltransferase involved in cell wall biosynthesis
MTKLSIVIPAYNEEDGIVTIVERVLAVRQVLIEMGVSELELLVVDDGSEDRTAELASSISDVILIRHKVNRGYGAALKTGFNQASGELIGFLDADGTYPPEYFPKLCSAVRNGADLAVGSRMAGASSQMPATRRIGNLFFARLLSVIGRQHISDSASGMRVFRRGVLAQLYPLPDGLNLTPVMSTRAVHEGIRIVELPIPYSERVGRSKLSVVRDGSVFLHSIVWTALTYNPVRLLGAIGLVGMLVAFFSVLGLVLARLSGIVSLQPWQIVALYSGLVAGVGGVSVFAFGVTFNYLVSLFHGREIRQGLFGRPVFTKPLEHQFGWIGAASAVVGVGTALFTVVLGVVIQDWEIVRLSVYFLMSAMFVLAGLQLCIYWLLLRVLAELSKREGLHRESPMEESPVIPMEWDGASILTGNSPR